MPNSSRLETQIQGSPSRCTSSDGRSSRYGPLSKARPITRRTACLGSCLPSPFLQHVDFIREHPEYVAQNNAMGFLSDDGGVDYNLCHCTSFFSSHREHRSVFSSNGVAAWRGVTGTISLEQL